MWAQTNQSIFFIEHEEVAVADHFVTSVVTSCQQVSGKGLKEGKFLSHLPSALTHKLLEKVVGQKEHKADDSDLYLYETVGMQMVWPYDDRGRLIGENVWEPELSKAELFKLDPADAVTTEQAEKLLSPLIKPLPWFDEDMLGKGAAAGR